MQGAGVNRDAMGGKRIVEEEIISEIPIRHQIYMQNKELDIEAQVRCWAGDINIIVFILKIVFKVK